MDEEKKIHRWADESDEEESESFEEPQDNLPSHPPYFFIANNLSFKIKSPFELIQFFKLTQQEAQTTEINLEENQGRFRGSATIKTQSRSSAQKISRSNQQYHYGRIIYIKLQEQPKQKPRYLKTQRSENHIWRVHKEETNTLTWEDYTEDLKKILKIPQSRSERAFRRRGYRF